jgi:hypothetical protein
MGRRKPEGPVEIANEIVAPSRRSEFCRVPLVVPTAWLFVRCLQTGYRAARFHHAAFRARPDYTVRSPPFSAR